MYISTAYHGSDRRFVEFDFEATNRRYGDTDRGLLFFGLTRGDSYANRRHVYKVHIGYDRYAITGHDCHREGYCSYICTCYRQVFETRPDVQVVIRHEPDGTHLIARAPAVIDILEVTAGNAEWD